MAIKEPVDRTRLAPSAGPVRAVPAAKIPPLDTGDRLTRLEFERRYHNMPLLKKAELIEGIVYMPSPVRYESHGRPHMYVSTWLGTFVAATPGVGVGDNVTVRLDMDNEVQPDLLLRLEKGGQSRISEDDYIEGAPELIVEIAGTSAAYDLHDKLRVYRRNRVQEYVVWSVHDERLDWFELVEGEYAPLAADEHGILSSRAFPVLRLIAPALLDGDLARVVAELQTGLQSAEHAAFVERLTAQA